jgi:hypothetical protein
MTLELIRKHMLDYLSDFDSDDDDIYDEDGHCGGGLLAEIKGYWEDFNHVQDFEYLVSGEWMSDDLNLDGGRDYLILRSKVIPMLFDYMYNTLKWSKEQYEDKICDSLELTDELLDMYDDPAIIREQRMAIILEDDAEIINTVKKDKIVLKYPVDMKQELDSNPLLTFVGLSKIDNQSPIYSMEVPAGFSVVPIIYDLL